MKGERTMLEQLVTNHVLRYVLVGVVLLGVGMEVLLGVKYSRMIKRTLEMGTNTHPFTEKFKQNFFVSYKFGLNVNNVDKFVDKYVNKQKILGVFLCTWEKRCGQARILSGCIAVISLVLGIYMNCGKNALIDESVCLIFMCTMWISFIMLSDTRGKKKKLQWSLSEYLENVYIPRLQKEEADPVGFQKIQQELKKKEEMAKMQKSNKKETKKAKEKAPKVKKERTNVKREELERVKKELVAELKQERMKREKKAEELREKQEEAEVKLEKNMLEPKEEEKKTEDGEQLLQEILREYLGEV